MLNVSVLCKVSTLVLILAIQNIVMALDKRLDLVSVIFYRAIVLLWSALDLLTQFLRIDHHALLIEYGELIPMITAHLYLYLFASGQN